MDQETQLAPPAGTFRARRATAWAQLVMGWICAQSLLTLIPIAPPGWGAPALAVAGGGFGLWALDGLRRAVARGPFLSVAAEGIRLGARRLPWTGIAGWTEEPDGRAVRLCLVRGQGLRRGIRRGLRLDARRIEAPPGAIAAALRAHRPDLERP